ncbi:uncharacterized protein LOC110037049 [Phalaenopsis equestris]|uniref:uncharacterized protein LOC110037049 n=1 Tax=Phalaenopsis equestris TaxID=78828 RepID=UPI0009E5C797|nr:uncharacterized protein LOC110037049 [Phalaenopsis equestris]XP_020597271.1 uncharacterized protein LOC110037049 [Phalaenopsis equestris]
MDVRPLNVRWSEICDFDRRLSPQQKASNTNNSSDHPVTHEYRLWSGFNDAREMASGSREVKEDILVLESDMSCRQTVTNDTGLDVLRSNNEFKFDKTSDVDFNCNIKRGKDWVELMKSNPAKRSSRSPKDFSFSWHPVRQDTQCVDIDIGSKGEDKLKEKAQETKDWKSKTWRERGKDKNDNRSNMQGANNCVKRLIEERYVDMWKDNEEKEKNAVKKEVADMAGMECLPYGRHIDGQEALPLEPRKPKDGSIKGFDGKAAVATIVYEPGGSKLELYRLWKEFKSSLGNKSGDIKSDGPILDIRVQPQHISSTNRQLKYAQLWGTDVYTIDSDFVAVLIHTGYCQPLPSPLPAAMHELRASIKILPPQDCYRSTIRNNIHSRAWGSSAQCSYRIESCSIVKKGGEKIKIEPHFTRISGLEPTIAPLPFERKMITRAAAASSALSRQRFVREVSVQYNLCNEPWIKYSVSIVADRGMRKPLYTSARLKKGEVLYLETQFNRYELCFNGEKACLNNASASLQTREFHEKHQCHNSPVQACDWNEIDGKNIVDMFRWSRCKKALPENMMRSIGIPLPTEYLVVMEENLEWEDIQWSQAAVWIAGKEYNLARVQFLSPK